MIVSYQKILNKLYEDLWEICDQLDYTKNEYVKNCLDFLLNDSSECDFGRNFEEIEITS